MPLVGVWSGIALVAIGAAAIVLSVVSYTRTMNLAKDDAHAAFATQFGPDLASFSSYFSDLATALTSVADGVSSQGGVPSAAGYQRVRICELT